MSDNDGNITKPTIISLDELEKEEQPKPEPLSPERQDEQSVSGSMPDPESDDDTLKNEHKVGLQQNEGVENPQELNIAANVDSAEDFQKDH